MLLELAELAVARGDREGAREHLEEAASLAASGRAELYFGRAEELRCQL